MKGFIEFETCNHEKVFANVLHIISVVDGEAFRLICFNGGEHVYIKTNESYEEICNKIIDALSEEHKESEDAWSIMRLLFKAMDENGDAAKTQEQTTASTWVMMGGFPACDKCGCSPADWEDGFPPYCHGCGARMKNGRK